MTTSIRLCGALAVVISLTLATSAKASLIGDTVNIDLYNGLNTAVFSDSAVVNAGIEFIAAPSVFSWDVGDSSLHMTTTLTGPASTDYDLLPFPGSQAYWLFSSLDWIDNPTGYISDIIVSFEGVSANLLETQPGFSSDNVSFSDHTVKVAFGGYTFTPDAFIHIELITSHDIPEPASLLLVIAGLSLIWRQRRRTR